MGALNPFVFYMAQAKTLTEKELKRILAFIAIKRHAARNRAMLLMTHLAGMRVGEVAALRVSDVLSEDGVVRSEIRLLPEQTKGSRARTVFLNERLQKEVTTYLATLKRVQADMPLFYTQKRLAFSSNTLCQHFHFLYKEAGIDGASSHSGRRTFITNLASKCVGVRVLMALAGHQNIATTQRYIDVNDDMQRVAVELA